MDAKKLKLSEARRAIYQRNKKLVEEFKNQKECKRCHLILPHYMLGFAEDPSLPDSVSKLIINRASPERLTAAMQKAELLCLNHLAIWRHDRGLES